jgi:YfiH family protein
MFVMSLLPQPDDLPQPSGGFRWVQAAGLPALVCDPLLGLADHLFTTRAWPLGTRSIGNDEGWARVAEGVGIAADRLARVRQVHGSAVVNAAEALAGAFEADALISNRPDAAVAVQTADCIPLLLADRRSGAVAAVHAGWRGLASGTAPAAVAALADAFGTEPSEIIAAIGPSIGPCCYEVGDDVRDRFGGATGAAVTRWFSTRASRSERNPAAPGVVVAGRPGHWFFDGALAARDQLERAGVNPLRIFTSGLCTSSHPSVFCSYRRDGAPAGRMAAVIRSRPGR